MPRPTYNTKPHVVAARVDPDLATELERAALEKGTTVSSLVARTLADRFAPPTRARSQAPRIKRSA
jgi:hypothetical protein